MTEAVQGAIVFTDIVGFTELSDLQGDDAAVAMLERQDEVVRESLPDSARVVKELGDGLLLWFGDACAALTTCLTMQARFELEATSGCPLWVRMGVHWGRPRRRGDDIVGLDVNVAARITDLAGPGEVLCSAAAADAAQAGGPMANLAFEPLGAVFLRGIAQPVPLLRVVAAREPAR